MKVNIYYGGRGLIEDPTIFVMNKFTEVLEDLRVNVTRYNLYEKKNEITALSNTLKDADAIILAVNIEWIGIGGYMQQFLDACWLYADREKIKKIYMFPIVMANTYGEREAELSLIKAWEFLGGISCDGIAAYVTDHIEFETNPDFINIIEKKAEDLYKYVNKKIKFLPSSNAAVKQNISFEAPIDLTPQESEQLSVYVSDDTYVKKQKEDIEELTQLFKNLMGNNDNGEPKQEFLKEFHESYKPESIDFKASYQITMTDTDRTLVLEADGRFLKCYYGEKEDADVLATTTKTIINRIVNGRATFQGAFMSGDIKAKGDFKALRSFDQVFKFGDR